MLYIEKKSIDVFYIISVANKNDKQFTSTNQIFLWS